MPRLKSLLRRGIAAIFPAVLFVAPVLAQSSVTQGGPWVAGHAPMYAGPAGAQPIVQDSGSAAGGGTGVGLGELGITVRAPGPGPYANAGTGPLSTNFCDYDGPTTGQYHYLCFSANAQGGGLIAYGAGGGASTLGLSLLINGSPFVFSSAVTGPAGAVGNNFASFNGNSGTIIKDSGVNATSFLQAANNLSDVSSASTSRTNLGVPTGTSGHVLPFLDGNNQFSGAMEIGSPTGGMPSAGVLNATSLLVNNVAVLTANQSITLSGDTTGTGTTAITTTTGQVHGVIYPAGPALNTVPVVTSASGGGTTTYEAVPNAALANSTITLNTGSNVGLTTPGAMSLGSTYTIGATTDMPRFASLGLGGAPSGTNMMTIYGTSTGHIDFKVPAAAGTNVLTFPAGTTDFTATGGTSQVLKQVGAAAAITVGQLACADLSNGSASCSTDTTNASNITTGTLGLTVQGNITHTGTLTAGATGAGYTVALGTSTLTGQVPAANGGTGAASPTAHGVAVAQGSSAFNFPTDGGTAGRCFLSNGTGVDPSFQACPASSSGSATTLYTTAGSHSYAIPGIANVVHVVICGAAGGGGTGNGNGGGGGAGGSCNEGWFRATDLSSPVTVTNGTGGAAIVTTNSTGGNPGTDTTFGGYLTAYGGAGGLGTTSVGGGGAGLIADGSSSTGGRLGGGAGGAANSPGSDASMGSAGGGGGGGNNGTGAGGIGGYSAQGCAGGGGGGGTNASTAGAGGAGGTNLYGTGGTAGSTGTNGGTGGNGTPTIASWYGQGGAGGGAGTTGTGGTGGNGSNCGGGGGGGGRASGAAQSSGKGGDGWALIEAW